jgi:hypothetical protein
MSRNRITEFENFLLRAEALGHERDAFRDSFHIHLEHMSFDHDALMDICDLRLSRGMPMPWVEKEIERTCWNCTQSRLCFLKQRMDSLLRAGCNILNIDGHAAPGRCYRDLHLALGRSCMLYEENPDAD